MTDRPRRAGRPFRLATAAALLAAIPPAAASAQTIAITGGTVFPVSGPRIEHGTVLIRDGRIAAVGADVQIPADARRIDARGTWVTPGLFNAATQLGLVEISAVSGTREESLRDTAVAAAFNVLEGINPASQLIPVTRAAGVTTVVSGPSGGLIAGQAVALDLDGASLEEMVIASPVAMVAAVNEGAKDAAGGSRAGVMARFRRLLADAQEYDRRRTEYRRGRSRRSSSEGGTCRSRAGSASCWSATASCRRDTDSASGER
jgi:imidazolonepropionase-like amidohydrolase